MSRRVLRFQQVAVIVLVMAMFPALPSVLLAQKPGEHNGAETPLSGSEIVQRVQELYEAGKISDAEHLALKSLDNPEGLSRFERFELYQLLAFCAVANDDEIGGVRQFVEALRLYPTLTPDFITWSPKIRKAFSRAREVYDEQMQIEALTRRMRAADICRRASVHSLYLPGSGQFRKKNQTKGIICGGLFWGAAAALIYSQFVLPDFETKYQAAATPEEAITRWKDYRDIYRLRNISLGLTASIYVIAFVDALWTAPDARLLEDT